MGVAAAFIGALGATAGVPRFRWEVGGDSGAHRSVAGCNRCRCQREEGGGALTGGPEVLVEKREKEGVAAVAHSGWAGPMEKRRGEGRRKGNGPAGEIGPTGQKRERVREKEISFLFCRVFQVHFQMSFESSFRFDKTKHHRKYNAVA